MKFSKLFVGLTFFIVLSLSYLNAAIRSSSSLSNKDVSPMHSHFFEPTHLVRQMLLNFLPDVHYEKYFDFKTISESMWRDHLRKVLRERRLEVNKEDAHGNTLLHHAAYHGDLTLVKLLVYAGAFIWAENKLHQTPEKLAKLNGHRVVSDWLNRHYQFLKDAADGKIEEVEKALNAGCYVNVIRDCKLNDTPLRRAFYYEKKDVVRKLLSVTGIDVKSKNYVGHTVLHDALSLLCTSANDFYLHAIQLLCRTEGVDVNSKALDGNTPLHFVVRYEDDDSIQAAQILLEAGADQTITNNAGFTPSDISYIKGNTQLVDLLETFQYQEEEE